MIERSNRQSYWDSSRFFWQSMKPLSINYRISLKPLGEMLKLMRNQETGIEFHDLGGRCLTAPTKNSNSENEMTDDYREWKMKGYNVTQITFSVSSPGEFDIDWNPDWNRGLIWVDYLLVVCVSSGRPLSLLSLGSSQERDCNRTLETHNKWARRSNQISVRHASAIFLWLNGVIHLSVFWSPDLCVFSRNCNNVHDIWCILDVFLSNGQLQDKLLQLEGKLAPEQVRK